MADYTDLTELSKTVGKKLTIRAENEDRVINTIPIRVLGVSMETLKIENGGVVRDISILEFFNQFCKNNREAWFFSLLLLYFDSRTGISVVPSYQFTKTEQNKISLAYKKMAAANMVHRVKPHTYLVNPKLITPYKNCIDAVFEDWRKVTGNEP